MTRYDYYDSPCGRMLLVAEGDALCGAYFVGQKHMREPESGWTSDPRARPLVQAKRELDEYFEGRRRDFDLELDLRAAPTFHRRVLEELARVGYGHTTTYGALAAQTGNPRAARAIGTVMNRNPVPIVLPCHRVVGSNGSLTGYGGGLDRKEWLLRLEGAIL